MKRLLLLSLIALPLIADEVPAPNLGEKAEKLIRDALPICAEDAKVTKAALQHKLPVNLVGSVIQIDSKRQSCQGQWIALKSTDGDFYIGTPWFLDGIEATTLEERLKQFTYKAMQETWSPVVDRTKTRDGFYPVTISETTERGKLPYEGLVDPAGTMFLFGRFMPITANIREERVKSLEPFLQNSPTTGAAKPAVTVIEFSDFECPSCQRAASYLKPVLAKHSDQVRYVRYDLPLMQMHPWALAAAIAGRAIHRQKPELFWEYKESIYANQDKLNAFLIDDFARNWAKDHDVDMTKYDAEVASDDLRNSIVKGAGMALSVADVRATPTYMVNGAFVDPGNDGKALENYVDALLKK